MPRTAVKDRHPKCCWEEEEMQCKDTERSRRASQPLRERSSLQAHYASAALAFTQRQSAQHKHRPEHSKPVRAC